MAKSKRKLLAPVHANPGLGALYKRRLDRMLDALHASVVKWTLAAYRKEPPAMLELAQDAKKSANPKDALASKVVDELTDQWLKKFDQGAKELARYFATAASKRSDARLKKILSDSGFAVEFAPTKAQRQILAATVQENVSLIKSIPEQYLKSVETHVTQAVQTGMDVGGLAKKLEQSYGVSKRRARFISRDQNTKATSAFNRARQLELGVEKAIWVHSHAGKKPRPSHLRNDGKEYDVKTGWYDPDEGEFVQPGQLINCRCTSRAVIEGFI